MPNKDPTLPLSDSHSSDDEDHDLSHVPPAHQDLVRHLRTKVERATALLTRLQAENQRLQRRIEELERRPAIPADKTALALDDDPEQLREQITSFIDTIDAYLEAEPTDPEETNASPAGDGSA